MSDTPKYEPFQSNPFVNQIFEEIKAAEEAGMDIKDYLEMKDAEELEMSIEDYRKMIAEAEKEIEEELEGMGV